MFEQFGTPIASKLAYYNCRRSLCLGLYCGLCFNNGRRIMKAIKLLSIIALGCSLSACGHYAKEHSVYFNSGSSTLTAQEKAQIAKIAKNHRHGSNILTSRISDKKHVYVISYTDSIGNEKMNEKLSKKRAVAVKNVLVNAGMDADEIEVMARGEVTSDTRKNASLRRVDVSIF
jgi:hypothetical protein